MFVNDHSTPFKPENTAETRVARHLLALDEMVEVGLDLMRLVQKQAHVEVETAARLSEPAPDFTGAFERITRTIRRTILLAQKIAQPVKASERPGQDQIAARRQIIRSVEDAIAADAPVEKAESLHAELLERLERPELAEDIGQRPVADIIVEIRRDLGIAGRLGMQPWKRRTPQDLTVLFTRAAAPGAQLGPFNLPMPPPGWTDNDPADTGSAPWQDAAPIRGP